MHDVVLALVEDPQRVRRPGRIGLGGVVDHDVEPHLDVVVVGRVDELGELLGGAIAGGVLPMDRAEHERHVPPVVALVGVELVDGEQLQHGHAEFGEAREFVDRGAERAGVGPRATQR